MLKYCFYFLTATTLFSAFGAETLLLLTPSEKKFQTNSKLQKSGLLVLRKHSLSYGDLYVLANTQKSNLKNLKEQFPNSLIGPNQNINFDQFNKPLPLSFLKNETGSLFEQQWGLNNTGDNIPTQADASPPGLGIKGVDTQALEAWDVTTGDESIIIAVMDTGVDVRHPNLINNIYINQKEKNGKAGIDDDGNGLIDDIHGYDFGDNDNDVSDYLGHGTHVAGIIGAEHNGSGIKGVLGRVKILPLKIFTNANTLNVEGVVRALDYAAKMKAKVASNSWGGGNYSLLIENAIKEAAKSNMLIVAAAGNESNDNDKNPKYPASYPVDNVISVASHNHKEFISYFSNFGKETVHLSAPGDYILSTMPNNAYTVWSGTSMATPYVSGAIGLLLSHETRNLPYLEIKKRLQETTTPSFNYFEKTKSMGRLNLYNLLKDIRPSRGIPLESDWIDFKLDQPVSLSPLPKNLNKIFKWKVPEAKFMRLIIKDFDLRRYNSANVRNPKTRSEFQKIQGFGTSLTTKFVKGNEIGIRVTSGRTSSGKIIIEKIQYTLK